VDIFASLPVYVGGPLFVLGFVAIAVGGSLLAHRIFPKGVLEEHNDIAGFMFAVVGVVYAVLLAFLAIAVWERFDAAETRVHDEASQLVLVYGRVDAFPDQRVELRKKISEYTDVVISDEWPKMNSGKSSERANRLVEEIATAARGLNVKTATQQDLLTSIINGLQTAMMDRNDRLMLSNTGLNAFLWTILFLGAGAVIIFSYLFAFKSSGAQAAMIGLLAFTLALVLYLIAVIDYPYRGDVRIQSGPFVEASHTMHTIGL
jgi:hypothetical protein